MLKQLNSWYLDSNLVSDENNSMQLEPHLIPKKNIKTFSNIPQIKKMRCYNSILEYFLKYYKFKAIILHQTPPITWETFLWQMTCRNVFQLYIKYFTHLAT